MWDTESMTAAELREAIAEARRALPRREREEEERRKGRPESSESSGSACAEEGRWLAAQTRVCGRCARCRRGGRPHGPYWYLFGYAAGKKTSRYVGRRLPAGTAEKFGLRKLSGKTPEEAYPERYLGGIAEAVRTVFGGPPYADDPADAYLGRRLARTDFARWTPHQRRAAWEMLARRRGARLREAGVDLGDVLEPPETEAGMASDRAFVLRGGGFGVSFSYNEDLVAEVKRIPGRRYDGTSQTWRIPARSEALEPLAELVAGYGLDFDVALVRRIWEVSEAEARERKRRSRNAELSRASEASLEVAGLGGDLRPFQRAAVDYALRNRRVFLADEMGLGKTVEALATVQAADAYPALVVCPASLKLNWEREAKRWLPGRSVTVLRGKKSANYSAGDVLIVNYDLLHKHEAGLAARGFRAIVLDESHYAKNHRARRTELCRRLAQDVPVRLLLSGTPLLNHPRELISQLEILGRLDEMGGFWYYAERYCGMRKGEFGVQMGEPRNLNELNARLRETCFVRRLKAEVLGELPPKQRAMFPVEITNRREYDRARRDVVQFVGEVAANDERRVAQAAARHEAEHGEKPDADAMRRLRGEIRNGAEAKAERAEQLVRIEMLKQLAARGKREAICNWVETFLESGEKLVLFAHHREVVEALAERFDAPSVTGDTPVEARQEAVDRFQNDPETRLIVLNIKAGGVGLTLTAASNVAFAELGWTPAEHDQAEDRCHRIGQTGSLTAWYFVAERTIDVDIHELIEAKRTIVNRATQGGRVDAAVVNVLSEIVARLRAAKT